MCSLTDAAVKSLGAMFEHAHGRRHGLDGLHRYEYGVGIEHDTGNHLAGRGPYLDLCPRAAGLQGLAFTRGNKTGPAGYGAHGLAALNGFGVA